MDFVKIRGKDLQDCFMQMKMKYGPEAHVYDQKIITEGGLLGTNLLSKKYVEIEVGIPEKTDSKKKVEEKLNDLKELLKRKPGIDRSKTLDTLKPFTSTLGKKTKLQENEIHNEEMVDLGLSISKEISQKDQNKFTKDSSPQIDQLKIKFLQFGFSEEFCNEVQYKLNIGLSILDKNSKEKVFEKAKKIIEEKIRTNSSILKRNKRKILFFIGPTGSGKTTSIAKIAAKYFLHDNKTVSVYTTDNYRIAAIEQLKRYADTMGIPFFAVRELKKFKENLDRDGSELILIDTAGYSHKNKEQIQKMKEIFAMIEEGDEQENILVLSATSSKSNAESVIQAYENLNYNRILLTKIDEVEFLAPFVELADKYNKEFFYYSVGQEVPFDILEADCEKLADCVVNPEKVSKMAGEVFVVS